VLFADAGHFISAETLLSIIPPGDAAKNDRP